jgi:hypothetical protein
MSAQQKEMRKEMQEARTTQQDMMKRMEELITNRLSPATSIQPTPSVTPPPPGEDIVPPRLPTPSTLHAYEHFRVPTIPSIDKLKGRSNYQTWTINITFHARNFDIWSAIQGKPVSQRQEDLAQSLIGLNVITAIQHQIRKLTAAQAWTYLQQRYNTRNICQITKTVQELCHINYDKFNSIETFQQRVLSLKRQITEFTTSLEEAFHVLIAAHILNSIGKADNIIKGQIENSLNSERLEYNDELEQHIFDKLFAFRNPRGRPNVNAVNNQPSNNGQECKICKHIHGPTCWVEYPEKAPRGKQQHYRKLHEQYLSEKKKNEKGEKEGPKDVGSISYINQSNTDDLCLDSGSPCHIIKDRHLFIELQPSHRKFSVANGTPLEAHGFGKIQIRSPGIVTISNAYYCPNATQNLISMEQIFQRGMEIRPKGTKPYTQADLFVNGKQFFNLELKDATVRIITQPEPINAVTTRSMAMQQALEQATQQTPKPTTHPAQEKTIEKAPQQAPQKALEQIPEQAKGQAKQTVNFEDGQPIYDNINVKPNKSPTPAKPKPTEVTPPQGNAQGKGQEPKEENNHNATTPTQKNEGEQKHKRPKATIHEWHNNLAHLSNTQIRKLHNAGLIEVKSFKQEHETCNICCQSKAIKHPSRQRMPESSRPFERIHFDIIGGKDSLPFNNERYKYILVVIDDYTRYKWAFPLNKKSQATIKLQWLIQTWKSQFREYAQAKVAYLHSDDAAEWTKGIFQ